MAFVHIRTAKQHWVWIGKRDRTVIDSVGLLSYHIQVSGCKGLPRGEIE